MWTLFSKIMIFLMCADHDQAVETNWYNFFKKACLSAIVVNYFYTSFKTVWNISSRYTEPLLTFLFLVS